MKPDNSKRLVEAVKELRQAYLSLSTARGYDLAARDTAARHLNEAIERLEDMTGLPHPRSEVKDETISVGRFEPMPDLEPEKLPSLASDDKLLADLSELAKPPDFSTCPLCGNVSLGKPPLIERLNTTAETRHVKPSDLVSDLLTTALDRPDAASRTPKQNRSRRSNQTKGKNNEQKRGG
jgi:hypothetical protein